MIISAYLLRRENSFQCCLWIVVIKVHMIYIAYWDITMIHPHDSSDREENLSLFELLDQKTAKKKEKKRKIANFILLIVYSEKQLFTREK